MTDWSVIVNIAFGQPSSRRRDRQDWAAPETIVIASKAKQSISPRKGRMDCFVACAPVRKRFAFVAGNDGKRSFAFPRHDPPRSKKVRSSPAKAAHVASALA